MAEILLVHGAWQGPWCWEDFASRLAERGHDVHAVRLSGHDQRPGRIWHRIRTYVDDVVQAAAEFPDPPIVVGNSLGGLVVQKYLERHPAPAAVLMASIPPRGATRLTAGLIVHHPLVFAEANLLLSFRPFIATPDLVRELFFTAETPQDTVDRCLANLQDESGVPRCAVLRAAETAPDRGTGARAGRETGRGARRRRGTATGHAYRTEAEIFPGMGHVMMLDVGWQQVADRIDAWVQELPQP